MFSDSRSTSLPRERSNPSLQTSGCPREEPTPECDEPEPRNVVWSLLQARAQHAGQSPLSEGDALTWPCFPARSGSAVVPALNGHTGTGGALVANKKSLLQFRSKCKKKKKKERERKEKENEKKKKGKKSFFHALNPSKYLHPWDCHQNAAHYKTSTLH